MGDTTKDYVAETVERLLTNRNWMFGPNETHTRTEPKKRRNGSCICGSGKKYKKCCIKNQKEKDFYGK